MDEQGQHGIASGGAGQDHKSIQNAESAPTFPIYFLWRKCLLL